MSQYLDFKDFQDPNLFSFLFTERDALIFNKLIDSDKATAYAINCLYYHHMPMDDIGRLMTSVYLRKGTILLLDPFSNVITFLHEDLPSVNFNEENDLKNVFVDRINVRLKHTALWVDSKTNEIKHALIRPYRSIYLDLVVSFSLTLVAYIRIEGRRRG